MIVIVGAVVSTVTALLAVHALFVLFTLSLTFHAATANVLVPAAFAVYVNLYVIPFVVVHVTALLLNVTTLLSCVIAPLVNDSVFIHAPLSVHFNVTVHVLYPATNEIGLLLGCTSTLHAGFVVSIFSILLLPLYVVFHTLSTALKHTYVLLSLSLLNVNTVHAVYAFVAELHVELVHVL